MKYLMVAVVVFLGYALWKHNRQQERAERDAQQAPKHTTNRPSPQPPVAMINCRHCGVHLPVSEAVEGQFGVYCGKAHRQLAEG